MATDETRVLLVCANPRGSDPLRTAEEDRTLRESVQLSRHRSRIHVDTLHAATIDDLRRALLRAEYQIVHFSGHGTQSGLVFEDALGKLMVPSSSALAELFERRHIATVILNACYSLSVGHITSVGVEYTIASSGPIADPAAVEFTRGFYDAVGEGLAVPEAFEEGLSCARLKGFHPDVVLLRKGEVHVGRQTPGQPDTEEQSRVNVLVGIALDTSGSMHESMRNDTGGALSRLEGAQRAIRRLGQSVQSELQKRMGSSDANAETFRVFAYGFGLRHREVGDLLALFRAAQTMDIQKEVERRRLAYTRQAEQSAAGYGGLANLARQYGFGGVVDSLAAGARAEAERSIRERITNEVSDLLFSRAAAIGDATLSANELSALWNDESDLTVESIEPLIYGNTPMRRAAEEIAARFQRTAPVSDAEKRILIVISDGEPTDGDPRTIFASIQQAGVTMVSCFVTDENIAEPRMLVALPQPSWGAGARLMFEIASPLDEREELASQLLSQGWTIEPGAKLFVQVNHSEVLGEFVRAAGADIVASGGTSLPEGR